MSEDVKERDTDEEEDAQGEESRGKKGHNG